MRRVLIAIGLALLPPLSVAACLWDRDTPSSEAKGMPEVVAVLTGRFERNPALFYQMRLKRVSADLQSHPENLVLYDDAGVACDRLGRGDEAIAWMEKKRAELNKLDASRPDVKEQTYRYHANLGTFYVHRWARQGADRSKIDEVKQARDEIAKALAINPDAHFGREKYQLKALEWIIDPPTVKDVSDLPNILGWSFDDLYGENTDPKEADEAVRGLAGLIVLGNAWESIDIFHALNIALQRDSVGFTRGREGGRNTLAHFAWRRCVELIDAGKGSMLPDAPKGVQLKNLLRKPDALDTAGLLDASYTKLRAEAETWQSARTAYMIKRLEEGRHPDTDSTFWNGYTERPAPNLPTQSVPEAYGAWVEGRKRLAVGVMIGIPMLVIGLVAAWKIRSGRRRVGAS